LICNCISKVQVSREGRVFLTILISMNSVVESLFSEQPQARVWIVAAIAEGNMSTRGGGKGTPSYKQIVVDKGKGPRGIVFKAPMKDTSGSNPGIG
jgi:hypothetical protein